MLSVSRFTMLWKWSIYVTILNLFPVFYKQVRSSDVKIPCDKGWFHFRDKCYRSSSRDELVNWHNAAYRCSYNGGHLVTIQSKEELDFVIAFLLLDVKHDVWIGLHDTDNETDYSWHDGSSVNFTNWMRFEPGLPTSIDEDCVEMVFSADRNSVGQWNDVLCSETELPYICQKKTDPLIKTPDPKFCSLEEGGGWKFQASCYHVVEVRQTWYKAEEYCRENFNGHLVTVLDVGIDYFLDYILDDLKEDSWIGLKIKDQFQQKWTSSWHVSYTGLTTRRGNFREGFCVLRDKRKAWIQVECSKKYPFVCETSKAVPPVLNRAINGSHCPTDFIDWRDLDGEYCYFIEGKQSVTWNEANSECNKRGGNLTSIHSREENDILHPFVRLSQWGIYTGLYRQQPNGSLQWVDGTEVDYENWAPHQPDNNEGKDGCGEVWTWSMEWNDLPCDFKRGYICKVKKLPPDNPDEISPSSTSGHWSFKAFIGTIIFLVILLLGIAIYCFRPCSKWNFGPDREKAIFNRFRRRAATQQIKYSASSQNTQYASSTQSFESDHPLFKVSNQPPISNIMQFRSQTECDEPIYETMT